MIKDYMTFNECLNLVFNGGIDVIEFSSGDKDYKITKEGVKVIKHTFDNRMVPDITIDKHLFLNKDVMVKVENVKFSKGD